MIYKVTARFHQEKLREFFTALTDGSIENQKPDGSTILKAMQEAIMIDDDTLSWYEHCYCATPLRHERETVYDKYLFEIKTLLVQERQDDIVGKSFWEYLEKL